MTHRATSGANNLRSQRCVETSDLPASAEKMRQALATLQSEDDMNCRRTNHLHREFLILVESAIERGDMTIERAADFMLEHRIQPGVARNLLTRVQAGTAPHPGTGSQA